MKNIFYSTGILTFLIIHLIVVSGLARNEVILDSTVVVFNDANLELLVRNHLNIPSGPIYDVDMALIWSLDASFLDVVDLTGLEYAVNIVHLRASFNQIKDLSPVKDLQQLNTLDVEYNEITDISFLANLPNLSYVFLYLNEITDISPLQNNSSIYLLDLGSNPITDLSPITSMTGLNTLKVGSIGFDDLSFVSPLTNLELLEIGANNISDLTPIENHTNLKYLSAGFNQISDISMLNSLTNLMSIEMADNLISDISVLSNMKRLTYVSLPINQIENLNVFGHLDSIRQLILYNNRIEDVSSIHDMAFLTGLDLYFNNVKDIEPLKNLPNLEFLDLGINQVTDIYPLIDFPKLNFLVLRNNRIEDITPLTALTNLEQLYISSNYLDHADLPFMYILDKLTQLDISYNSGILSGVEVEKLANELPLLNCSTINWWDGTCGMDENKVAICWATPFDSVAIHQTFVVQSTSTDANHGLVQMKVNWGDGTESDWSDLQPNGSNFRFYHSYPTELVYNVVAIGRNAQGVDLGMSYVWVIKVVPEIISEIKDSDILDIPFQTNIYPNPFIDEVTIETDLKKAGRLDIKIVDNLGRLILQLENGHHTPGIYKETRRIPDLDPGIYYFKVQFENYAIVRKMVKLSLE